MPNATPTTCKKTALCWEGEPDTDWVYAWQYLQTHDHMGDFDRNTKHQKPSIWADKCETVVNHEPNINLYTM